MLFSLSTQHELGLAVAGAPVHHLRAALLVRLHPEEPELPGQKGLRWYIPLCVLFFVGMMAAVLVFGREKPSAEAAAGTTTTTATAPAGDATAGKAVFTSAGCAACHTFKPAGSTGKVGPNLDDLAEYAQKAGQPLERLHPERDHEPAAEVRAARVPDERDALQLRPDALAEAARRSRRVPRRRRASRRAGSVPGPPLRFACPGEVAEWLKAAPC